MVGAILLAAGTSSRYGANKLLLPFGEGTVISTTAWAVARAGIRPMVVVTGYEQAKVESALQGLPIMLAHNPDYEAGEMLSSVKAGLRYLEQWPGDGAATPDTLQAAMIVLGDQPLLSPEIVRRLADAFIQQCGAIIAPRYGLYGRRGHPVILSRRFWGEVLALPAGRNVRDVLHAHQDLLAQMVVDTDAILLDVDTPEAYKAALDKRRRV